MEIKKTPSKISIILAIALAVSLIANIVLAVLLVKEINDSRRLYDPEYAVGGDAVTDTEQIESTDVHDVLISTKYITLVLSGGLKDRISYETKENENGIEVIFTNDEYSEDLILFSFSLTKEETDNFILGTLTDETDGELYVAMNVNEQAPEDWSEEEYKEICTLQENVNDFILQFYDDDRFVPSR